MVLPGYLSRGGSYFLRLALGVICTLLAVLLTVRYPGERLLLGGACLVVALACVLRPNLWLFLLPALLPVLDLAPWTGSLYVEEFDVLLLAGLAGAYAGIRRHAVERTLGLTGGLAVGLFALSMTVAAVRGAWPLPDWDANALATYYSRYNALRVFKGLAWAMLALPLVAATAREDLRRWLVPGMLAGLGGCAAAVMLERWLFPGLMDFAADYRAVGMFSGMHVGGAALDGYLALALPFAFVPLAGGAAAWAVATSLAVLAAGAYAVMASFSRGLYAGAAVGAAAFVALRWRELRKSTGAPRRWTRPALAAAVLLLGSPVVFAGGGYRGLAAYLAGGWTCWVVAGLPATLKVRLLGVAGGVANAGALAALSGLVPKGPYVATALAALLAIAALFAHRFRPGAGVAAFATGAAVALALLAAGVTLHWGGGTVWGGALTGLMASLVAGGLNLARGPGPGDWRAAFLPATLTVLVLMVVVPVLGNYQMAHRFQETQQDLAGRLAHWRSVVWAMDRDATGQAIGMGLGRFPDVFLWTQSGEQVPGLLRFVEERGNTFLRLSGPRAEHGGTELLRYGQRITDSGSHAYTVRLRARNPGPPAAISVEICAKWLLYASGCASRGLRIESGSEWREHEVRLVRGVADDSFERWLRPLQFAIGTPPARAAIEIDDVRVIDAQARELIVNGGFEQGPAGWFYTSDRHHLPYHEKSLPLHVLFAQGWTGLGALTFWLVIAGRRQWRAVAHTDALAPALTAALAGFLVVGAFDSLFDFPRIAFLFYLLLIVATQRDLRCDGRHQRQAP